MRAAAITNINAKKSGCSKDELIMDEWISYNVHKYKFDLPKGMHFYIRLDQSRPKSGDNMYFRINSLYLFKMDKGKTGELINLSPFMQQAYGNDQFYRNKYDDGDNRKNTVVRNMLPWTGFYLPNTSHIFDT